MRTIWAAGLLLRRLRSEAGAALLLVGVVAVTSFLFAAAPRAFNVVADAGLRHALAGGTVTERNVRISTVGAGPPGGGDTLAMIDRVGQQQLDDFPTSVRQLIQERGETVTSIRFSVAGAAINDTRMRLRQQSGVEPEIELLSGRLPQGTGDALGGDRSETPPRGAPPLFEIAVSEQTAQILQVQPGEVLTAFGDPEDSLLITTFLPETEIRLAVVGIFRVRDPNAEIWYGDRSLYLTTLGGSIEQPTAFATALVSPDAVPGLFASGLPFALEWRYFTDLEHVDADQLAALQPDLLRLGSGFASGGPVYSPAGGIRLQTGLSALVTDFLEQRAAAGAVLSLAIIGPLVMAAGAIAMVAVVLVTRRRAALDLARGRGASGSLILGAQLWEAGLLGGSGALLGWAMADQVVPGRETILSPAFGLATLVIALLALLGATWPAVRARLSRGRLDDEGALGMRGAAPPSGRRLVLEATVVLLAVGGALILRRRGVTVSAAGLASFDPYLAAVPVLLGLAAGIVTVRAYPPLVGLLGRALARRRDLVPFLGLRTVGARSGVIRLPLVVLVLTAAFASFASVVDTSLARGQSESAFLEVGADFRVDGSQGSALPPTLDPAAVPGTSNVAAAHVEEAAPFATAEGQEATTYLAAIDAAGYGPMLARARVDPFSPALMAGAGTGTPDDPIPAVLSRRLPAGTGVIGISDTFRVTVGGEALTFQVAELRVTFPGVPGDVPFVIAPLAPLRQAAPPDAMPTTTYLVLGSEQLGPELQRVIDERAAAARLTSRYEVEDQIADAPLVAVVPVGFRIALVVAALYTAAAVVASLTLSAGARSTEVALLRTLGLSRPQALGLTLVEHAPLLVLTLAEGALLGLGISALLQPGLGLQAFAGGVPEVRIEVDGVAVLLVNIGLLAVVALAIGLGSWLAARRRMTDMLRLGGD